MPSISLKEASLEIPILNHSLSGIVQAGLYKFGIVPPKTVRPRAIKAIEQISFDLSDGDRFGLIGSNGAGKTSLLKLIGGIYQPSSGTVSVAGDSTLLLNTSLGIEADLTGREAITLRAQLMGKGSLMTRARLFSIIDFSGLEDAIDLPTRTYSSGMLMRLAFAVSTAFSPEILIMDEWLSVGDEDFRARSEARMKDLVANTRVLVLASHSEDLVTEVCNKALWLEHGKAKMVGPAEAIAREYFQTPRI